MNKTNAHKYLLVIFITCLVMNAITHGDGLLAMVGKYGKLIVAVIGIMILHKSFYEVKSFIRVNRLLVFFWLISFLFSVLRTLKYGFDFILIQHGVLFMLFIYFYGSISNRFEELHLLPYYHFFKLVATVLNVNLVFWTMIAVAFQYNIWHTLEGRTGLGLFYENYIQMGIFSATGALVNFSVLKYNNRKGKILHIIMFAVFCILAILSGSRNAQFIIGVFVIINSFPYIKKAGIKYIYSFIIIILVFFTFYFTSNTLLSDNFISFTSGRSSIWYHIYEHYQQISIFTGEGIMGLNETILNKYVEDSYYYQRIDVLSFHNSYIEVFTAGGLVSFIFFIVYLIKKIETKKRFYIITIIISIMAGGIFESFLVQPTILISCLFWYLLIANEKKIKAKTIEI